MRALDDWPSIGACTIFVLSVLMQRALISSLVLPRSFQVKNYVGTPLVSWSEYATYEVSSCMFPPTCMLSMLRNSLTASWFGVLTRIILDPNFRRTMASWRFFASLERASAMA